MKIELKCSCMVKQSVPFYYKKPDISLQLPVQAHFLRGVQILLMVNHLQLHYLANPLFGSQVGTYLCLVVMCALVS